MKTITLTGLAASALLALPVVAQGIDCFAPGMTTSAKLTAAGGTLSVDLGEPFRYEIWGISGSLILGNAAVGTKLKSGEFTPTANSSKVNSFSWVKLQVNAEDYPANLYISGGEPGISTGPVNLKSDHWVINQRQGINKVNLVFHLAGSNNSTTLYPNSNPTGSFVVLGEYQKTPPPPTGTIAASPKMVKVGESTGVTWQINRAGSASDYKCSACAPTGVSTIIGTPVVTGTVVIGDGNSNNGHGNNLDGVDVSNPGQGHGGPNGAIDLSGSIDDEGGAGFKRKLR